MCQDNSGHQRSVTEQHNDNERTTARHNIKITGAPYVDNDRSASRYASKARDDWARLVADLQSGAFTEDVLIMWENSRYSRKTSEWLYLMELCEERGKKIFITPGLAGHNAPHGGLSHTWGGRFLVWPSPFAGQVDIVTVARTTVAQAQQGKDSYSVREQLGHLQEYAHAYLS